MRQSSLFRRRALLPRGVAGCRKREPRGPDRTSHSLVQIDMFHYRSSASARGNVQHTDKSKHLPVDLSRPFNYICHTVDVMHEKLRGQHLGSEIPVIPFALGPLPLLSDLHNVRLGRMADRKIKVSRLRHNEVSNSFAVWIQLPSGTVRVVQLLFLSCVRCGDAPVHCSTLANVAELFAQSFHLRSANIT
jgi:hypothetical protein